MQIVRSGGKEHDAEQSGELWVRGNNVFKMYWGQPDKTAEAFAPDGWFRTGGQCTGPNWPDVFERSLQCVRVRLLPPERHLTLAVGWCGNELSRAFGTPRAVRCVCRRDSLVSLGDEAAVVDGRYSIRGRMSVDIIKSAGYKVSALDVEAALSAHPNIAECAVVAVPDRVYGTADGVLSSTDWCLFGVREMFGVSFTGSVAVPLYP